MNLQSLILPNLEASTLNMIGAVDFLVNSFLAKYVGFDAQVFSIIQSNYHEFKWACF